MTDYITFAEAAAILGVTDSRVRQLVGNGTLTVRRYIKGPLLARADVEAYATTPRKGGWPKGRPRVKKP